MGPACVGVAGPDRDLAFLHPEATYARPCDELGSLAGSQASEELEAIAAQARSTVELARGDGHAAVPGLRVAGQTWQRLEAPYETVSCVKDLGQFLGLLIMQRLLPS
jgi:hypothetical protein